MAYNQVINAMVKQSHYNGAPKPPKKKNPPKKKAAPKKKAPKKFNGKTKNT